MLFGGYTAIAGTVALLGLLLTKVLLPGPVGDADNSATRWLSEHRGAAADSITNALSRSADTLGAIGIALIVVALLAVGRHWRYIAALALGLGLELSIFLVVNLIVDRPRPDVIKLGSEPDTSSFPSGHSAATTVIYVLIALCVSATVRRRILRVAAWCVAILMPCAVAFARVYRGMHHPTDVVFGILMGVAALTVALATVEAVRANTAPAEPAHDDVDTRVDVAA